MPRLSIFKKIAVENQTIAPTNVASTTHFNTLANNIVSSFQVSFIDFLKNNYFVVSIANFLRNFKATFTKLIKTGTSINGPITVANA